MDALQHTSPSTPTVSRLETTQLHDDGAFTCGKSANSPGFCMLAAKNSVAAISIDSVDFTDLDPSDARINAISSATDARNGAPSLRAAHMFARYSVSVRINPARDRFSHFRSRSPPPYH